MIPSRYSHYFISIFEGCKEIPYPKRECIPEEEHEDKDVAQKQQQQQQQLHAQHLQQQQQQQQQHQQQQQQQQQQMNLQNSIQPPPEKRMRPNGPPNMNPTNEYQVKKIVFIYLFFFENYITCF
jgi:FtsZ-interacting cell division protein YlmF